MFVEDLLVVFGCFLFCVERSKVARGLYYVVREPLVPVSGEECVSKVIWLLFAGGAVTKVGGRTALQKRKQEREFNPTRGYPGERGHPIGNREQFRLRYFRDSICIISEFLTALLLWFRLHYFCGFGCNISVVSAAIFLWLRLRYFCGFGCDSSVVSAAIFLWI